MQEQFYRRAKKRHGQLHRDVVHDMYLKFGSELPSPAYVHTCIQHAKPEPLQQLFEPSALEPEQSYSDIQEEQATTYKVLSRAVNNVRDSFPLEVDTFLECHVNGSYDSFSERSGISRSVLEKICKFAKHEIHIEFNRIKEYS